MKKILLILTGGTICSFRDSTGHNASDAGRAAPILTELLRNSDSPVKDTEFDVIRPLDTLSENMTVEKWNVLMDTLRQVDYSAYSGILIAHGTDTLHLTAPLLGVVMEGCPIPVGLVSSQRILDDPEANGGENFIRSVEYIAALSERTESDEVNAGPVFTVYRNMDGVTYFHKGVSLLKCGDFSEDFFSVGMRTFEEALSQIDRGNEEYSGGKTGEMPLLKMKPLRESVLVIEPYVGINYDNYDIGRVNHVLHLTYHSGTADSERVAAFIERCRKSGVDVYLAPVQADFRYSTTAGLIDAGAKFMPGITMGEAYARLLLKDALV